MHTSINRSTLLSGFGPGRFRRTRATLLHLVRSGGSVGSACSTSPGRRYRCVFNSGVRCDLMSGRLGTYSQRRLLADRCLPAIGGTRPSSDPGSGGASLATFRVPRSFISSGRSAGRRPYGKLCIKPMNDRLPTTTPSIAACPLEPQLKGRPLASFQCSK
jgi:hypothetical protein